MAYEKQEWGNYQWDDSLSHEENLEAARNADALITTEKMEHIEDGIENIELTPGPEGPEGPQGPQGEAGKDGQDGFPSEEEWNVLVARVSELEAALDEA